MAKVTISEYTDKSIIVTGETYPIKAQLKAMGGLWNGKNVGWIFAKTKEADIRAFLDTGEAQTAEATPYVRKERAANTYEPTLGQALMYVSLLATVLDKRFGNGNYLEAIKKGEFSIGDTITVWLENYFYFTMYNEETEKYEDIYKKDAEKIEIKTGIKTYITPEQDLVVRFTFPDMSYPRPSMSNNLRIISKLGTVRETYGLDLGEIKSKMKEVVLPEFVTIPENKRKPHYNLAEKPKLKSNVVTQELLLGKMMVAQRSGFDGMTDSSYYIKRSDMNFHIPTPSEVFSKYKGEEVRLSDGEIIIGSYSTTYEAKYIGKAAPKRFYLNAFGSQKTAEQSKPKEFTSPEKLRAMASTLEEAAVARTSGGVFSQNYTRRRGAMMDNMEKDAKFMRKKANLLRIIADFIENGEAEKLPVGLAYISSANQIDELIYAAGNLKRLTETGRSNEISQQIRHPRSYVDTVHATYRDEQIKKANRFEKLGIETQNHILEVARWINTFVGNEGQVTNEQKIKKLENELRLQKIAGFFPTPKTLANILIDYANVQPNDTILEPSAGIGSLAEIIRERYPNNPMECIEQYVFMVEIMRLKGFKVESGDFLQYTKKHDVVIMNPPFENNQDIDHVMHAYSLLNAGGRVAAIVGAGAYNENASIKKRRDFYDFVNDNGIATEPYTEQFKGAESFKQTGVSVRIIMLEKPAESRRNTPALQIKKVAKLATKSRILPPAKDMVETASKATIQELETSTLRNGTVVLAKKNRAVQYSNLTQANAKLEKLKKQNIEVEVYGNYPYYIKILNPNSSFQIKKVAKLATKSRILPPAKEVVETTSKATIQAAINGLEVLVKYGNKEAQKAIDGLKVLLKYAK